MTREMIIEKLKEAGFTNLNVNQIIEKTGIWIDASAFQSKHIMIFGPPDSGMTSIILEFREE
jgi:hypothetical protein